MGMVALIICSPLLLIVAGALVKAGALLVARSDHARGEVPDAPTDHRLRLFETKAQRSRLLVVIALVFLVGSSWLSSWGAAAADRAAARRVEQIRSGLDGHTPESLSRANLEGVFSGGGGLPGGPYRVAVVGSDRFSATAEVHERLQYRCIHVEVDAAGVVSTRITNRRCGG